MDMEIVYCFFGLIFLLLFILGMFTKPAKKLIGRFLDEEEEKGLIALLFVFLIGGIILFFGSQY
jgi:hypothetical protein